MLEAGRTLEQPGSLQVIIANFGSWVRRAAVSWSKGDKACVLEIASLLPGKNKAEVDGAHRQSAHRPETWNGKGRIQPLVTYQRMSGQDPPWNLKFSVSLTGLRKLRPMTKSELSILEGKGRFSTFFFGWREGNYSSFAHVLHLGQPQYLEHVTGGIHSGNSDVSPVFSPDFTSTLSLQLHQKEL